MSDPTWFAFKDKKPDRDRMVWLYRQEWLRPSPAKLGLYRTIWILLEGSLIPEPDDLWAEVVFPKSPEGEL